MVQRRIVTLIGSIALTVLGVGYAARTTSAGSSPADAAASPSAKASELSGTWRGSFNIVGGDADRQGDVALDIKDDATYNLDPEGHDEQ
jgi:hypothetical protein